MQEVFLRIEFYYSLNLSNYKMYQPSIFYIDLFLSQQNEVHEYYGYLILPICLFQIVFSHFTLNNFILNF